MLLPCDDERDQPPPGWVLFLLGSCAGALLGMLLAAVLAHAAPAPLPRPRPPAAPDRVAQLQLRDLWGDWVLAWGDGDWELSLSPFGVYRCRTAGSDSEWVGSWHLDSDGQLCVEERHVSPDGAGAPWQWYVVWSRDKAGKVSRALPAGEALWVEDGRRAATVALRRKR